MKTILYVCADDNWTSNVRVLFDLHKGETAQRCEQNLLKKYNIAKTEFHHETYGFRLNYLKSFVQK